MKKSPFTAEELRAIEEFCAEARLSVALAPDRIDDPVVAEYFATKDASNGRVGGHRPEPGDRRAPVLLQHAAALDAARGACSG